MSTPTQPVAATMAPPPSKSGGGVYLPVQQLQEAEQDASRRASNEEPSEDLTSILEVRRGERET